MTIHILQHGIPLCRFTFGLPCDWPKDDEWVRKGDKRADCKRCIEEHEYQEEHRSSTLPAYNGLKEE